MDLRCQLLVREAANERLLGDEVPAVGGLDPPVDVPRGQRNAVSPRIHVRRLGAVPVADRLAVVHGGEPLVGPGKGRVVQAADELARVQVQGGDGAVLGVLCDEGVAARPEGVVDLDVVQLQLGEPLVFGVNVGPDGLAGGVVEVDYFWPVRYWHCAVQICQYENWPMMKKRESVTKGYSRAIGNTRIDHPPATNRVKHNVLHIDKTGRGILAVRTVLPFLRRPWNLLCERGGPRHGVVLLLHVPGVRKEDVVLGVYRDASRSYGTLVDKLRYISNNLQVTRACSDGVGVVASRRVWDRASQGQGRTVWDCGT